VAPSAAAAYIKVASWSPDGRWLAYWASDQADIDGQQPATMPGGMLHFHEVIVGETCTISQLQTPHDREASVQWSDDDSVIVVNPDGAYGGRPCQSEPFTLLTDYQPPQIAQTDPALSPDGRFRVLSTQTASENGILTFENQLVTVEDGKELAAVSWQIDERLGDYSGWLGGEWVSPTQFIIYETWKQGPLLLDAEQGVVPILTDWLNLDTIPSLEDEAGFSLTARPVFSAETNTYHLLISGVGLEENFPLLRLYHAESGLVETLPYTHVYWQLGQGTWIFLDSRPIVDGHETQEIWMRRLEATGNEWQLLASDVDGISWSENKTEIVFTQGETAVIWQTFPGGETLGQWETSPYWTLPVAFSPDGRFVVTTGNKPGQWAYGLFILQR
jgi:WD40 repeat protein